MADRPTYVWTGSDWDTIADPGAVRKTLVDAKGDLVTATANDTPARLAVGADNTILVAASGQTTGLAWSNTLSGLTLTTPTINNATQNTPIIIGAEERCDVVASAATGTINLDIKTATVLYYTANATANHTLNVRGDSTTTLSSLIATNDSVTVAWLVTNGATAYYPSTIQIDGVTVTPKWQGGSAPSSGNASSIDAYTFTIIKIASTPTYTVLGAQTRFA